MDGKNGYLQVLTNKANLDVVKAQNEVTQEQISRTSELVDAGVLPKGDLLEIRATDATEKQQIAVAENTVKISLISLAQLLAIRDYETFDIEDEGYDIVDDGISQKNVDDIIEAAKENRSEIKIAQANLDLAEKDLQISRGSYYPTLSAFFGYNTRYTDATSFTQVVDQDNPFRTEQIGIVQETGQTVVGQFPNTILQETTAEPFIDQLYLNDGI